MQMADRMTLSHCFDPPPEDSHGGCDRRDRPPTEGRSLNGLAVERKIETLALNLIGHAQADEDVDDLEND